ncbi:MAG: bactofilin family protein [Spirochaetota bacterium]
MADTKEIVEDENKIDTVIADDIVFKGTLVFKKSLKIKGQFEGKISSDGHIIVGQEANVNANINAEIISVNGRANGKLKASKCVELYNKSTTSGDIISPDVQIEKGAIFNGTCFMQES